MLNPDLKLNIKLFDDKAEQVPTRDGYGDGLAIAGRENSNVVVLTADLSESTRTHKFAQEFPGRFFECGIQEQNMMAVAAGLAVSGKIPFISSYATFSPGRNWEQIRTLGSYDGSNVKIAGHHAGVSVGPDGATHQATEDIAIMRILPNVKCFSGCDAIEAKKTTIAASKIYGPVYLRFHREKTPIITTEETSFVPGKVSVLWISKKPEVLIFGTGPLVFNALKAAFELEDNGIATLVVNVSTIKPLDEVGILELAKKIPRAISVEEHQIAGGLGGALAELFAKHNPIPMEFIGLNNTFGESGPPGALIEKYGMGVKDIKSAVKKVLRRKI